MIVPNRVSETTAEQKSGAVVELAVTAFGAACLEFDELAMLRREPPDFARRLAPQLLKRSDEQTLAALVALQGALSAHAPAEHDYANWAVLAESRCLGRSSSAAVIDKYPTGGPWGVSVHSPAHASPHAVASTVSLALGNCGPSIGVGGGPGAEPSVLLTAVCLLQQHAWEGCWVLLSGWSPELEIWPDGSPRWASQCLAVAVGLVAGSPARRFGQVRVRSLGDEQAALDSAAMGGQPLLESLQHAPNQPWRAQCGDALLVELELTFGQQTTGDARKYRTDAGHRSVPLVPDRGEKLRASHATDPVPAERF